MNKNMSSLDKLLDQIIQQHRQKNAEPSARQTAIYDRKNTERPRERRSEAQSSAATEAGSDSDILKTLIRDLESLKQSFGDTPISSSGGPIKVDGARETAVVPRGTEVPGHKPAEGIAGRSKSRSRSLSPRNRHGDNKLQRTSNRRSQSPRRRKSRSPAPKGRRSPPSPGTRRNRRSPGPQWKRGRASSPRRRKLSPKAEDRDRSPLRGTDGKGVQKGAFDSRHNKSSQPATGAGKSDAEGLKSDELELFSIQMLLEQVSESLNKLRNLQHSPKTDVIDDLIRSHKTRVRIYTEKLDRLIKRGSITALKHFWGKYTETMGKVEDIWKNMSNSGYHNYDTDDAFLSRLLLIVKNVICHLKVLSHLRAQEEDVFVEMSQAKSELERAQGLQETTRQNPHAQILISGLKAKLQGKYHAYKSIQAQINKEMMAREIDPNPSEDITYQPVLAPSSSAAPSQSVGPSVFSLSMPGFPPLMNQPPPAIPPPMYSAQSYSPIVSQAAAPTFPGPLPPVILPPAPVPPPGMVNDWRLPAAPKPSMPTAKIEPQSLKATDNKPRQPQITENKNNTKRENNSQRADDPELADLRKELARLIQLKRTPEVQRLIDKQRETITNCERRILIKKAKPNRSSGKDNNSTDKQSSLPTAPGRREGRSRSPSKRDRRESHNQKAGERDPRRSSPSRGHIPALMSIQNSNIPELQTGEPKSNESLGSSSSMMDSPEAKKHESDMNDPEAMESILKLVEARQGLEQLLIMPRTPDVEKCIDTLQSKMLLHLRRLKAVPGDVDPNSEEIGIGHLLVILYDCGKKMWHLQLSARNVLIDQVLKTQQERITIASRRLSVLMSRIHERSLQDAWNAFEKVVVNLVNTSLDLTRLDVSRKQAEEECIVGLFKIAHRRFCALVQQMCTLVKALLIKIREDESRVVELLDTEKDKLARVLARLERAPNDKVLFDLTQLHRRNVSTMRADLGIIRTEIQVLTVIQPDGQEQQTSK